MSNTILCALNSWKCAENSRNSIFVSKNISPEFYVSRQKIFKSKFWHTMHNPAAKCRPVSHSLNKNKYRITSKETNHTSKNHTKNCIICNFSKISLKKGPGKKGTGKIVKQKASQFLFHPTLVTDFVFGFIKSKKMKISKEKKHY